MTRLTLMLLALLCVAGCDKEDTPEPPSFKESDLLGTWKITARSGDKPYDWNGDGTQETDIYATYSDCRKQALFLIQTGGNGTHKYDCTGQKFFSWKLENGEWVWWYASQGPTREKIIALTATVLKTEVAHEMFAENKWVVVTTTYQKQ